MRVVYNTDKYFCFPVRLEMLRKAGVTDEDIQRFVDEHPDRLHPSISHFILDRNEDTLKERHPESYKLMEKNLTKQRLQGRTHWCCAGDIAIDILFTEMMMHIFYRYRDESFSIEKNGQDRYGSLIRNAGHDPDLVILSPDGREICKVEMKIGGNLKYNDEHKRSVWSPKTFTLRKDYIYREYGAYKEYNTEESPLYFLRINHTENQFSIIRYGDFMNSKKGDGTIYAEHSPIDYENMYDLGEKIVKELKNRLWYMLG